MVDRRLVLTFAFVTSVAAAQLAAGSVAARLAESADATHPVPADAAPGLTASR